jgi:hypothetical protein
MLFRALTIEGQNPHDGGAVGKADPASNTSFRRFTDIESFKAYLAKDVLGEVVTP